MSSKLIWSLAMACVWPFTSWVIVGLGILSLEQWFYFLLFMCSFGVGYRFYNRR